MTKDGFTSDGDDPAKRKSDLRDEEDRIEPEPPIAPERTVEDASEAPPPPSAPAAREDDD